MSRSKVLIADGDRAVRRSLRLCLRDEPLDLLEASDPGQAASFLERESPSLVVAGSALDGSWDWLALAQASPELTGSVPTILCCRLGSEERAVAALRAGFRDYLRLPVTPAELLESVRRVLDVCVRAGAPPFPFSEGRLVGESEGIRHLREYLPKVAARDCNVLVTGETGTGKERVAELVHRHSRRRDRPFVCVNCAALPEGLFESELFGHERGAFTGAQAAYPGRFALADGGTLFLDEIGDMSAAAQAKILRAVETREIFPVGALRPRPVDVRIVAATNQDLEAAVAGGRFRRDLYYRLDVARLHLPPLRERREDVPLLVEHFLADLNRRCGVRVAGLTADALGLLCAHEWPGNVRELQNLLEVLSIDPPPGRVCPSDLPEPLRSRLSAPADGLSAERDRVLTALVATNWNKSRAAEELRWSRMTLYRKMEKHGIAPRQPAETPAPAPARGPDGLSHL